jgi:hypothetical protein
MPPRASLKKQVLNLAQLSAYDDILTDALIDHVRILVRPSRRIG